MEVLKVLRTRRAASEHLFIYGKKYLHSATFSPRPFCPNNRLLNHNHCNQSSFTRAKPSNGSVFGINLTHSSLKIPLNGRFTVNYSSNALNDTTSDTSEDEKNKSASVNAKDEDDGGSSSSSGDESDGSSSEEESATETTSPSKSQTGEPLPSELDQTAWDNKIEKLYKEIQLEVLAYEPSVLDSYQWFVLTSATHLGIKIGKCWSPAKSEKLRFALLKSAFVHKKHQVQYEIRTHHRYLTFHKLTSSTADTFLEYIERNLPEGVGLKVTRVEVKPLPQYLHAQHQQ